MTHFKNIPHAALRRLIADREAKAANPELEPWAAENLTHEAQQLRAARDAALFAAAADPNDAPKMRLALFTPTPEFEATVYALLLLAVMCVGGAVAVIAYAWR